LERNAFIDNAKVILVFLVVFGHMIQPFVSGSNPMNTLYMWIYTFHMPAFILLAGFFAKGLGDFKYVINLMKKLIVPYIIFQVIYSGYYYLIGNPGWQTDLFSPHWSLWFLFSLFCWHMLLYWFKKIPPALGITIAIQMGLIVGYFGEIGHTFSLSRTFVFFPFFLIGYWVTEKQLLQTVKNKQMKFISIGIMAVLAISIYFLPDFQTGWLLASSSYSDLGMSEYGGLMRLLVYAVAGLMVISIFAWIPRKHYRWTKLGTRTLYVYLLHGFFIQFFRQAELFEINNLFDVLGLAALSAALVILLSSRPIVGIWQPLIEGRFSILKNAFRNRWKNEPKTES